LRNIARRLDSGVADVSRAATSPRAAAPSATADDAGFMLRQDPPDAGRAEPVAQSPSPPSGASWQDEPAARNRGRDDPPSAAPAAEPAPAIKPRRNLLFSSSSRKERERAEARVTDPSLPDLRAPPPETGEAPPVAFDDAWPQSERARPAPPPRSSGRPPAAHPEAIPAPSRADRYPPATRSEDQAPVTILKSGVVDGMAYSLYSDGSIEAQMPEGMMRFGSIDELRSHLDQRP
jgi:hypothetical protein